MSFKRDENYNFVPTKNFKMPKPVKRTLAMIGDKDKRDHWRYAMAQAVMQSFEIVEKKQKKGSLTVITE